MSRQQAIRGLLNEWQRRRWRDVDDAALTIVRELAEGRSAAEAASSVSRTMLDANGITRAELATAIDTAAPSPPVAQPLRLVVLTAIPVEYEAVVARLAGRERVQTSHGTHFEHGDLDGPAPCELYVAEIGPGNLGAAAEVVAAVQEFEPDGVLFVGVAGGIKGDLEIGDVVVATQVHYYESGRAVEDGFKARPVSVPTDHRLDQLARTEARAFDGDVQVKPLAAGESLVASSRSEVAAILDSHYNDAVAVDMESAGVYRAAHRVDVPCLAIRGISDRLDDKTATADADKQPVAAEAAASFMQQLVTSRDAPRAFGRTDGS